MTDFEDRVRAAMRAHDDEAPTDLTVPGVRAAQSAATTGPTGRTWLPIAAAAAVVVVVVGIAVALGGHRSVAPGTARNSDGSLVCPTSYDRSARNHEWVPSNPTVPGASAHLVPNRTPSSAVVCAYTAPAYETHPSSHVPLDRSRTLTGNLRTVPSSLARLAGGKPTTTQTGFCTLDLEAQDGNNYLLGLTYGSRTLWVSVPANHCSGASNGSFQTEANLRALTASAYAARSWTPVPAGAGRLTITGRADPELSPHGTRTRTFAASTGVPDRIAKRIDAALTVDDPHKCLVSTLFIHYRLYFTYSDAQNVTAAVVSGGCEISVGQYISRPTRDGALSTALHHALYGS